MGAGAEWMATRWTERIEPVEVIEGGKSNKSLTPKQRKFARMVASGESYAASYATAYAANKSSKSTIQSEGSRTAGLPHVTAYIEELQRDKERLVRTDVAGQRSWILDRLKNEATGDNPTSRIKALELLGKSVGLFDTTQVLVRDAERSPDEIERDLHDKLAAIAAAVNDS